ncbi:hypothetical protein CMA01_23520 [Carnobacterium maltaromaticum]|nr:hypothetical protein CMA01_23520 [Carnobacterium maltaromaticum]
MFCLRSYYNCPFFLLVKCAKIEHFIFYLEFCSIIKLSMNQIINYLKVEGEFNMEIIPTDFVEILPVALVVAW